MTEAAAKNSLRQRHAWLLALLAAGLLLCFALSCALGDKAISLGTVATELTNFGAEEPSIDGVVVREIRLPRAILGLLVGAMLAVSGAAMQAMFRNPLADPGLIGVSAGGAAGAIIFIVFGGWLISQFSGMPGEAESVARAVSFFRETGLIVFPMVGGILVTFLVYRLAQVNGRTEVTTMLLVGIAVNALMGAIIGYAIAFSTDEQIRDFTFWTLGSLARASWGELKILAPIVIFLTAWLLRYTRQLNLLLLGESEALHLGVKVETVRRNLIFATAAGVGLTVAFCGAIGFIGLVTPHLCRLMGGADHRWVLPASILLGGALLVLADLLARIAIEFSELPVGVLTATLGAPFFIGLIIAGRKRAAFS